MKRLILVIVFAMLLPVTAKSGDIVVASLSNQPEENQTKIADDDSSVDVAVTCFKQYEQVSGMNKICFYNCVGSTVAITISSVSLCPLTINQ